MFERHLSAELRAAAKEFPIVTVVGPRQSGKTTLAQAVFPDKQYVSLEDPDRRRLAATDPRAFLADLPDGAILDEIQHLPELLSYLQTDVDREKTVGRWVLTGSHQAALHEGISQSLAGRTIPVTLLPMSLAELDDAGIAWKVPDIILNGFYPRLHERSATARRFYRAYYQTYVERDVRQLIQLRDLVAFDNFMRLLAGHVGQIVNYSQLGGQVGVSHHTVREWLTVLEASYLVFRLPAYFENFNKRIIKSPRLYFTDVGLAAYLLGIETVAQLKRDPSYGRLYENLVVIECLKRRHNAGQEPEMYCFRDAHGHEVDLLFRRGHRLLAAEIKAAQTPQPAMTRGLDKFAALAGDQLESSWVIYNGENQRSKGVRFLNLQNLNELI